jgi:hypothetical protein
LRTRKREWDWRAGGESERMTWSREKDVNGLLGSREKEVSR